MRESQDTLEKGLILLFGALLQKAGLQGIMHRCSACMQGMLLAEEIVLN